MSPCFECGEPAKTNHHIVPRVLGGTKTVALCDGCHAKAHGRHGHWNTSELTKEALAAKRAAGLFCGGCVPFGWRASNGILEPLEPELAVRQLIIVWRRAGSSLWQICRTLDGLGVKTKTGRSGWQEATIRKICRTR